VESLQGKLNILLINGVNYVHSEYLRLIGIIVNNGDCVMMVLRRHHGWAICLEGKCVLIGLLV